MGGEGKAEYRPTSIPRPAPIYRDGRYFGEAGGSAIGSQPSDDVISAQSGGGQSLFSAPSPPPPRPDLPRSGYQPALGPVHPRESGVRERHTTLPHPKGGFPWVQGPGDGSCTWVLSVGGGGGGG